jgi:predicted Zn-dependent peptidase
LVFLLEDRDVPLVRLYLAFRGGSLYDPPEKAGLAQVAALGWRTGGAGKLDPEAVDETLDGKGMELSLWIGRETGRISLSVLPADLDEGLDLLAKVVKEPAFRTERVSWAVKQVTERIQREADEPQGLAFREIRRALYQGHPRGVVPTAATVGQVTRNDVRAFHRRILREGTWVMGAVGDFEAQSLLEQLEAHLADLPVAGAGFRRFPPPPEREPHLFLVPKRLPQSTIVWARLGPARLDPSFYALAVADHVVGSGGFQARLVREIRSNRGLAYSVGSYFQALPEFGVLGAFALTKVESTGEVLGLMRQLIGTVAEQGLEPEEVERAKDALINRHVFRYEDPGNTVRERMSLFLDELPPQLVAEYPTGIASVSPADVAAAVRTFYAQGQGMTVVVGDVPLDSLHWKDGPPMNVLEIP